MAVARGYLGLPSKFPSVNQGFDVLILSEPRTMKVVGPTERLMRNPLSWLAAWVGGVFNIGRISAQFDPFLFLGVVFAVVTLPAMLWSYPAWANRKIPARGLAVGRGLLFWPYPWMFHPGSGSGPAVERTYKHRIPRAWVASGTTSHGMSVTAGWRMQGIRVVLIPESEMAAPSDGLEATLHQIAVSNGKEERRVCKCTDPSMRLVPVLRYLAAPQPNEGARPAVVAREVGTDGT